MEFVAIAGSDDNAINAELAIQGTARPGKTCLVLRRGPVEAAYFYLVPSQQHPPNAVGMDGFAGPSVEGERIHALIAVFS
jgi:hypothetical protein